MDQIRFFLLQDLPREIKIRVGINIKVQVTGFPFVTISKDW